MTKNKTIKYKKYIFYYAVLALFIALTALVWFRFIVPNSGVNGLVKITKSDPLFTSPEMNLEAFNKSLSQLNNEQNELIKAVGLENEIVSTKLLANLVEVKTQNDIFLKEVTFANGEALLMAYKKTLNDYKGSISDLRGHLIQAFPLEKEQSFVSFGSSTTNKIMASDFDLMLKNAEKLESEIKHRENILNSKGLYIPKKVKIDLSKKPSEFVYSKASPEIYKNIFPVYLVKNDCYGQKSGENIFTFHEAVNEEGLKTFKPYLANNKYYQKLSPTLGLEKQFIDQGIEWRLITEGNTYRCNNLEYQAQLRNLVEFTANYQDKMLFTESNKQKSQISSNDVLWQKGQLFEQKLLTPNSYYSEQDLALLADYYKYFSSILPDDNDFKKELTQRYLFIDNKQAKIEEIVNTYFFLDDLYKRAKALPNKDQAEYLRQLYGTRMSYSFVFLNFSSAVWRLDSHPEYVGKYIKNDHFAQLADIKEKFSDEIIQRMDEIKYIEVRGY